MLENFIKVDKKELQADNVEVTLNSLDRAVKRRRMDLEDAIDKAKVHTKKVSTITNVEDVDGEAWLANREAALEQEALVVAKLKWFNEKFPVKEVEEEGEEEASE